MAEQLGDALLSLRTDDSAFDAGVARAKGKAEQLGRTMDATSGSATRLEGALDQSGKGADRAASSNDRLGKSMERTRARGREMVVSVGAQRAGMQQLGFQLGDIATMYSLGARPAQIFASQIGQVTQAVQLMGGGSGALGRVATFLGGPWGITLSVATIALAPFIAKLFETEEAADSARGALEEMIDARRRADLEDTKFGRAQAELNDLYRERAALIDEINKRGVPDPNGRLQFVFKQQQQLAEVNERIRAGELAKEFESNKSGVIGRVRGIFAEALNPKKRTGEDRAGGSRGSSGPDLADIESRFNSQLVSLAEQAIAAEARLVGSAEERAELEARLVELAHRRVASDIEGDKNLSSAQKDRLRQQLDVLTGFKRQQVEFDKQVRLEQEALQLSQERFRIETEGLRLQFDFANSQAERKRIALKILDAEQAHLAAVLEATIASKTASDAEKKRARLALDALNAQAELHRAQVSRGNETSREAFLRTVGRTPVQINEALDDVAIDGLMAFNDGLATAISRFESLGDVATSVLQQIYADLLRLVIRQTITAPLAGLLFGGGSGGGGLLGSLFSGFKADGGLIPAGTFGIVGERGPEPVIATPQGALVKPNSSLREGGFANAPVNINFYGPVSNAEQVRRSAAQAGAVLSRAVAAGQRGV